MLPLYFKALVFSLHSFFTYDHTNRLSYFSNLGAAVAQWYGTGLVAGEAGASPPLGCCRGALEQGIKPPPNCPRALRRMAAPFALWPPHTCYRSLICRGSGGLYFRVQHMHFIVCAVHCICMTMTIKLLLLLLLLLKKAVVIVVLRSKLTTAEINEFNPPTPSYPFSFHPVVGCCGTQSAVSRSRQSRTADN